MDDELLTTTEVARVLHIGMSTTLKLAHSGALPFSRIAGRKLLLRRSDLDAYLRSTQGR